MMVFRCASVGSQMYVDNEPEETLQVIGKSPDPSSTSRNVRPPGSGPGAGTPQEMANPVEGGTYNFRATYSGISILSNLLTK